ncbi:MAG: nicotinate-nucleotide adenylyltransferase [Gammaproteobacteria bacterium]
MLEAIGILGGSFDPVHNGHIQIAEYCYQQLALQQVKLIPVGQPVHRGTLRADGAHRLKMLQLAVADKPGLTADDIELQRDGPSYTIDTLQQIRQQQAAAALCLVMGADVFAGLHEWKQWRQLLEYAHIVVLNREAEKLPPPDPAMTKQLAAHTSTDTQLVHQQAAGKIFQLPLPLIAISATQIRDGLANRQAGSMLPTAVHDYIRDNKLYGYDRTD